MKKRFLAFIVLITIILSSFSSCIFYDMYQEKQMLKDLPKIERDEDGNFIYNGSTYVEDPYLTYGVNTGYTFIVETGHTVGHWEGDFSIHPVTAFGIEDFGEDICLRIMAEFPMPARYWYYIKSDFEFPDYTTLKLSNIYWGENYTHQQNDVEVINFGENDVWLEDIMTEVDESEFPSNQWKGRIHIFFKDYRTIYLTETYLYELDDELYLRIGSFTQEGKLYKINDEYVDVFKNAINNQ